MRKQFVLAVVLTIIWGGILSVASDVSAQTYSELWGKTGEKWSADGRLPDFSYAGYHCGETTIPTVPQVSNVKDFGAKGDGEHDDTQAFLDAIAQGKKGAIYIPAGRYKLTKIIEIKKSGVVLRGAGPDKSILFFPTPLNDINPNWGSTTGGQRTSNYSWSGGLVWFKGSFGSEPLANITTETKRGDTSLTVSSTENLKVGQRVEVFIKDDEQKTLTTHLYSDDPGNINKFGGSKGSFVVTITEVKGTRVVFDRPLRFDIKLGWKPQIRRFAPTVSESGIEDLGFEFPLTKYKGHFTELGYNAIAMSSVADCWVRNINIVNADSGLFIAAKFCTFSGLTFESKRKANRKMTGHHGIILGGTDNLCTEFNFNTRFIHDLGLSANHAGNVFSNGKGVDLNFDHHKRAPYENLYTNLDVGEGTRMWHCGGGRNLGKNCGARGTFWNIRAKRPQKYPSNKFGPQSMNLVGIQTNKPSVVNSEGKWFETLNPLKLQPQNLHEAQLKRRLELRNKKKNAGDGS